MEYKWIGAILTVAGCGGFGFTLAAMHRHEERSLRQLIAVLDYMACELQFRMTPLPELCRQASRESHGPVREVLLRLGNELDHQISPDVAGCMRTALSAAGDIPKQTSDNLTLLGNSLGRFDLDGQLGGLESVRSACRRDLEALTKDRDVRLRSYQTLGLCAGAALAILLI